MVCSVAGSGYAVGRGVGDFAVKESLGAGASRALLRFLFGWIFGSELDHAGEQIPGGNWAGAGELRLGVREIAHLVPQLTFGAREIPRCASG